MALPADGHVHTEWSWDASAGSMEQSCERARDLGLSTIAFTEHFDLTRWSIPLNARDVMREEGNLIRTDGTFIPPGFDADGYLNTLERCRGRFPRLRILSGVEIGEPNWFAEASEALLSSVYFDRVIGSMHSLRVGHRVSLVGHIIDECASDRLRVCRTIRDYFAHTQRMIETTDAFAVLGHIDYPFRSRLTQKFFSVSDFEEELRSVLGALASSGRALEINTRVPLASEILAWWRDGGGEAVCFGSDAHEPSSVAQGFARAATMAESMGYRAGRHPHDFWYR